MYRATQQSVASFELLTLLNFETLAVSNFEGRPISLN